MSLVERMRADLNQAQKKGDKTRVSVLRLMIANIHNAEIAKGGPLEEGDMLAVLSKQAKQHRESIEAFQKGKRSDLTAKEEAELGVVQEYLPQQMSREEIMAAARGVIDEMGARGPGDKGKVMSKLMAQLKGKAPGAEVSSVVSEILGG
jgi:uncharacterized protein YqeY